MRLPVQFLQICSQSSHQSRQQANLHIKYGGTIYQKGAYISCSNNSIHHSFYRFRSATHHNDHQRMHHIKRSGKGAAFPSQPFFPMGALPLSGKQQPHQEPEHQWQGDVHAVVSGPGEFSKKQAFACQQQ